MTKKLEYFGLKKKLEYFELTKTLEYKETGILWTDKEKFWNTLA